MRTTRKLTHAVLALFALIVVSSFALAAPAPTITGCDQNFVASGVPGNIGVTTNETTLPTVAGFVFNFEDQMALNKTDESAAVHQNPATENAVFKKSVLDEGVPNVANTGFNNIVQTGCGGTNTGIGLTNATAMVRINTMANAAAGGYTQLNL